MYPQARKHPSSYPDGGEPLEPRFSPVDEAQAHALYEACAAVHAMIVAFAEITLGGSGERVLALIDIAAMHGNRARMKGWPFLYRPARELARHVVEITRPPL